MTRTTDHQPIQQSAVARIIQKKYCLRVISLSIPFRAAARNTLSPRSQHEADALDAEGLEPVAEFRLRGLEGVGGGGALAGDGQRAALEAQGLEGKGQGRGQEGAGAVLEDRKDAGLRQLGGEAALLHRF